MSSLPTWLSSRVVMSAAVVGIVGAAGLYIYEQLYAEKQRAMLVKEMGRLDRQVANMREELQALRELQKESSRSSQARRARPRRLRAKPAAPAGTTAEGTTDQVDGGVDVSYASDSEYLTDYASIVGTDGEMDSEEFYDVHSDSESESRRPTLAAADLSPDLEGLVPNGTKQT